LIAVVGYNTMQSGLCKCSAHNPLQTFIPSYLWGGSVIASSAEATKPGPLRNPMQTALVSIYMSFWQTSVKQTSGNP